MFEFDVAGWSAWTPGLPGRTDFRAWAADPEADAKALRGDSEPDPGRVPSRMARRCSGITLMGLTAALTCCEASEVDEDAVQVAWATKHGEINVTVDLLETLAREELLSPTAFSNSVPNTPAAYFSILTDNHHPTRTLCAGEQSFAHGFLDALGMLADRPDQPVLLVQADGRLSGPLEPFGASGEFPFGAALILTRSRTPAFRFESRAPSNGPASDDAAEVPSALRFVRWLLREESPRLTQTGRRTWTWTRA